MRSGLPSSFLAALSTPGRRPRQLLEFYFASGTVYVSDQTYGAALADSYAPLVEDWGQLENTSDLQGFLEGSDTGTRQLTITLLNKGKDPFSSRFNNESPENVRVRLYQWFEGTPESEKVLIDEFVIQDPIEYGEAEMLLKLDLVSANQIANPYIGKLSASDNNFYGVVIGSVSNAPGTAYGSRPVVELAADISDTDTDILCTTDPAAAGFPAAGSIVIDHEQISYTGISTSTKAFTGCTRGVDAGENWSVAFPHQAGQHVFKHNHEYLYSFGQGPLDTMGPVYVDGEIYTGQHTIYKDRNPVQVGFLHGDPFSDAASSTIMVHRAADFVLGAYGSILPGVTWRNNTDAAIQSLDGTYHSMDVTHTGWVAGTQCAYQYSHQQNGMHQGIADHSELVSAMVMFDVRTMFEGSVRIEEHAYARPFGQSSGWTGTDSGQSGSSTKDFTLVCDVTAGGWAGAKTGYEGFLSTECVTQYAGSQYKYMNMLDCVTAEVQYRPYSKSHSTDITCDLSSGAGNTNPADGIRTVLATMGVAGYVDAASFAAARAWYDDNGYYFNGFVPGDMRCRDVLATMCQQCRSRLLYDGGVIKLLVRDNLQNKTVDQAFSMNATRLRSIRVTRQPVHDIINKLTLRYDAAVTMGDYSATVTVSDQDSQARFGLHEAVWDFFLVSDATMAQDLAGFYLAELRRPHVFFTFSAYLSGFPVEMDDCLAIGTDFSGIKTFIGDVAKIVRRFGSGKNRMINLYDFTVKSADPGMAQESLADTVGITDTIAAVIDPYGYGAGGYGEGGYGT